MGAVNPRHDVLIAHVCRLWLALVLVGGEIGCGAARPPATPHAGTINGTVLDEATSSPIARARVILCARISGAPVAVGEVWPHCDEYIDEVATDDRGKFSATQHASEKLGTIYLIAKDEEHVATVISGDTETLRARLTTAISLRRVATVRGRLILENGAPAVDGGFGFVAETSHGLVVQYVPCCTNSDGGFRIPIYDLPAKEVWLFGIPKGDSGRFAAQRADVAPGDAMELSLSAKDPLIVLPGVALTSDGKPLAGLLTAEMVEPSPSVLDRGLLRLQGGETDPAGRFAFYVAHPATLSVELRAWNADHSQRALARQRMVRKADAPPVRAAGKRTGRGQLCTGAARYTAATG